MKVTNLAMALAVVATTSAAAPAFSDYKGEPLPEKLSISASLRTRWELWNWFEPTGNQNNDYNFVGTVTRVGLKWQDEFFDVFVEGQNPALINLPGTAIAPAPEGPLGLGAVYYAHNRKNNDATVYLKQGYLTLKNVAIPGLSIKGGRFEFSDGGEVYSGDPTLDWLRKVRISQRLIGPFGFSDAGRSFDGVAASMNGAPLNLTAAWFRPTQGGFELDGMKEISDIDVVYGALNLLRPEWSRNSDARLFCIYYEDRRHQVKADNRPLPVRLDPANRRQDIGIHSGGGHLLQLVPTDAGPFDFLLWGLLQGGTWGPLDHFAWAWDVEAGWQPAALPWKPWFRLGYGRSSGDDDPDDGDHGTFFQILPTTRLYSYSTFYNLMNSEDAFFEIILRPIPGLSTRTSFHNLRVTESADLWYQGAGATLKNRNRPEGFGYLGRPANGNHDLFQVLETSIGYDWNEHINTNLYYSHVFGGSLVDDIFDGKQADFGYLEFTLRL